MKRKAIFSRDFLLVAMGQIVSLFGNQILRYALPLYLLNKTGSSALFGTISACAFLPMLLLYPVGGIIADRANKRNIMVLLDFSTAALAFFFCLLKDDISIALLVAVMMMVLYGIQGAYQPAVNASIPLLVDCTHLVEANSVVNVISSFANMTGSVIGGILFSILGLTPLLYLSIACFTASAVMEMFIRIPYEKKETGSSLFAVGFGDLKESFNFIFRKKPILWKMSFTYASVVLFLSSLVLIALPVLITQHLGFSPNTANRLYGYAQGAIAASSILGGVLAGALSKKLRPKHISLLIAGCAFSMLIGGITLQTMTTAIGVYMTLIIACSVLMLLSTLFQIQLMSYVQILTPPHLIGKVISCVICVCMCSNPIGTFIYGMVFERIGSNTYFPFYAAALVMIGVSLFTGRIFNHIDQQIESAAHKEKDVSPVEISSHS